MITLHYNKRSIKLNWNGSVLEVIFLFGNILLALVLIAKSWRKWVDPQIDYGREVYIPWLMSEGGKLFKDVDDLYGPLSRFIDAALFSLFGPGLMVLSYANLILYIPIFYFLYTLFKKGWGVLSAAASCFVFVGIFSFSQLTITSNYNFVAPYSQQVTHGFLLSLILIFLLSKWIERKTVKLNILIGFIVGSTLVLKPEFILVSGFLIITTLAVCIKNGTSPDLLCLMVFIFSACLPTLIFYLYFLTYFSPHTACLAAAHAWLNSFYIWNDPLTKHLLDSFSGLDKPIANGLLHLYSTFNALGLILFILGSAYIIEKTTILLGKICFSIVFASILVYIAIYVINWINIGQCLFGLLFIYISYIVILLFKSKNTASINTQYCIKLLISVTAFALMSRMLLNGRIYQYGFVQAALAAMIIPSALLSDITSINLLGNLGKKFFRAGIAFIIIVAVFTTISNSFRLLNAKTLSICTGSDLFYTYPSNISATGQIIGNFSDLLSKQPSDKSIIVIPEGIMINYLARKKSPVSDVNFYTGASAESVIVSKLKKSAPSWIIYISRDLTEYGVSQFGSKGQSGEELMNWIKANYHTVISMGGDPSNAKQVAGLIYELNAPQASIGRVDPSVVKP